LKNKQAEEIFRSFLKDGKNRITPERFEVMEAALEYKGHFGADDLFALMKTHKSRISRATVYNTLELLVRCNLLIKRNFGDNISRYENNFKKQRHDHIICVNCGKIVEFVNPKIKSLPEEICKEFGFELENYSFTIFARCLNSKDCKNSETV
jgi:Fur family ferric uptake transcriptional regulator